MKYGRTIMAVTPFRLGGLCFSRIFLESKCVCVSSVRIAHKYSHADVMPSRFTTIYRDLHGSIEDSSMAKDFVYALKKNERDFLLLELQKFDKQNNSGSSTDPPSSVQLKALTLHHSLPFIGFGFFDNFLMIIAGEYIEFKLGAALGISTMAAAAIGNWISDLAGLQMAHRVETIANKFGVKAPALTPEQVDMSATRWATIMGKVIGISIGCFVGMFPLLFFNKKKPDADSSETAEEQKPS